MLLIQALAHFHKYKFVKYKKTYGKNSANKTLSGVLETWRHVMAMQNPTQIFFYQLRFKTIVLMQNEIWLCEKT